MDAMHNDMLCMMSYELGFLICVFYPHFLGFNEFLKTQLLFVCFTQDFLGFEEFL
jgi:hypothetical protein